MFTQFFGNYLLSKNIITPEQLLNAIREQKNAHIKLGTLAIHSGLMSAGDVDRIIVLQTHQDKKFGELAIEEGFLTKEQVQHLLLQQTPDYLLLGQILIEQGILTNSAFENLLSDYQEETEIFDLDLIEDHRNLIHLLLKNLDKKNTSPEARYFSDYLELFFNNLIRFIGEDFTPLTPLIVTQTQTSHCATQSVTGNLNFCSILDMPKDICVAFASRYAKEAFSEYDDFVEASLEDFLNLHNGLFNVNLSNNETWELSLEPPVSYDNQAFQSDKGLCILPVIYTFGQVNFILRIL